MHDEIDMSFAAMSNAHTKYIKDLKLIKRKTRKKKRLTKWEFIFGTAAVLFILTEDITIFRAVSCCICLFMAIILEIKRSRI